MNAILMNATSSTICLAEAQNMGLASATEHASAQMDGAVTTAPVVLTKAFVKTQKVQQ